MDAGIQEPCLMRSLLLTAAEHEEKAAQGVRGVEGEERVTVDDVKGLCASLWTAGAETVRFPSLFFFSLLSKN
jgi:hypothetical protein